MKTSIVSYYVTKKRCIYFLPSYVRGFVSLFEILIFCSHFLYTDIVILCCYHL
ncbi:hypothetical protein WN944_003420 [Citrus x changshan-huyou]|uniref:Uncharacterized protein n=1 Tax=Citrus x changshan-huyou TaxID=2935761 RepID=A0AAP0M1D6_9ROSI